MPENSDIPYLLEPARLQWTDEDVPVSERFGDVYFSRGGGLAETRYVFLQHNRLAQRWTQLDSANPGCFRIGETGFGTGLNFLAAWQLWRQTAPAGWRLHFVSAEKHPLTARDLHRALAPWPELAEFGDALQAAYPPPLRGQHRLIFDDGQVVLDLLFGDAADTLRDLLDTTHPDHAHCGAVKMDAWFLDGFAPAGNPEMWRDELFDAISLLSSAGTTAATFTAAGTVRRGLSSKGFDVSKVAGWGKKREMLTATRTACAETPLKKPDRVPWHTPAKPNDARAVTVIGAGLAGAHTAAALARRGVEVTVLERHAESAREASGNPQGILYTRLSPRMETLSRFTIASFLFALRHYSAAPGQSGEDCGLLQLMQSDRDRDTLAALRDKFPDQQQWVQFVDAERASALAGVAIADPAVYYPGAGWLRPRDVCLRALDHPRIDLRPRVDVAALEQDGDEWLIRDGRGEIVQRASVVVLANGVDAAALSPCRFLPLKAIRGQLSYLDADQLTAVPRTVICHEGYLAPPDDGTFTIGATFDLQQRDTAVREADHCANLQQLERALPGLLRPGATAHGGRAGLRCTSPDYLPIVGAVPAPEAFADDYAALRKNAKSRIDRPGRYREGLYVNTAHGSRGLTSTPLCAEIVAALICGEPRPLPAPLMRALSPARFLIRDLIRKKR